MKNYSAMRAVDCGNVFRRKELISDQQYAVTVFYEGAYTHADVIAEKYACSA